MLTLGQGTVTPGNQTYPVGTVANLTATPAVNWRFSTWIGASGSENTTTLTMNSDKTVIAVFVREFYDLTTEI
jgi:hypothetical protein